MAKRLIDIKARETVLHTFPITVSDPEADTGVFTKKALEAAANAQLLPNEELELLGAVPHVSRPGRLEPVQDPLGVLAETKAGLDQVVREHAYKLWEQAGRPNERADEFWHQAQRQRWCERAYAMWEREGRRQGQSADHWYRTLSFENE